MNDEPVSFSEEELVMRSFTKNFDYYLVEESVEQSDQVIKSFYTILKNGEE